MMHLTAIALAGGAVLAAWYLTGRVRRYAIARQLLDVPTARSSHAVATPRGGGMAIVLVTLIALLAAGVLGLLRWPIIVGLSGSGVLVAAIGFIDDHRHVPRRWRLLAHAIAAAWVLWSMGGLPPVLNAAPDAEWAWYALGMLYVVWLINLTNFMDGIDGITGIEVATACLGGVFCAVISEPAASGWFEPLVLAGATLGFLAWNWPPAKVFLGDSGSGFLGLMLAAFALDAGRAVPDLFWSWNILLGVFVVDATITLLRRAFRGDRFYEPHRTHAYQHAAQRWGAHKPVVLAIAAINVGWLLPLAVLVARNVLDGPTGVVVAYAPLVAGTVWLRAGIPSSSRS